MIKTVDLTKKYGDAFAIKGIDLDLQPGDLFGFIGPNGAGKTTTFNLAVGNIKPDKGKILMNDKNITNLPLPIRSRQIGRAHV